MSGVGWLNMLESPQGQARDGIAPTRALATPSTHLVTGTKPVGHGLAHPWANVHVVHAPYTPVPNSALQ